MSARPTATLSALVAAAIAATISSTSPAARQAAPAGASFVDVPPLIAWSEGPEGTAWAGCMILLTGRAHGEPPPKLTTLCRTDGAPAVTFLTPTHAESRAIDAEKGPEGRLRVLVGRPGGIDEVVVDAPGAPARTATLVEDTRVDPRGLSDRPDLDGDGRPDLIQATHEGISAWRRRDDGLMVPLREWRVPPFAGFGDEWVTVRGRLFLVPFPETAERWSWPETIAGKRLRLYRVPLAPPGEVCAAWVDAGSQVWPSRAVVLSGEPPRLVALVAPADKVAVFGNLTLVVTPLACDDTARGSAPTLHVATAFDANIGWAALGVRDVTGDERPDILIVGRKGLVDQKLMVAVHPALPEGGFATSPSSESRSDLEPEAALWDSDVDADGRLDLVVLDRTKVMLARGIATRGPKDFPFDLRRPVIASLPNGMAGTRLLALVDFDGDGRLEAVVAGEERGKDDKKETFSVSTSGASEEEEKDARLAIVPLRGEP